jgi:polyisoprenoid-binding protein YceI
MKKAKYLFILAMATFAFFSCENKTTETAEEKTDTAVSPATDTATSPAPSAEAGTSYIVDTTSSIIKWTGKKVTGKHHGKIKILGGNLTAVNNVLNGGKITINMASISNDDLTKKEDNEKLIGHLKSEDFFSVEKYPSATFEITRIDAGKQENESIVTGKLTLKGKTEEISIPAKVKVDESTIEATGKTSIDRTKWDVRYGSGKYFEGLGDKMIYDDIELEIDLKAKK